MKKEYKISLAVMVGFLGLLYLEKPLRESLIPILIDEQLSKLIAGSIVRSSLVVVFFFVIKKLDLLEFSGLKPWRKIKNLQAVAIAFTIVTMTIFGNWNTYVNAEIRILLLFIVSVFAVGLVEEFALRGVVFPLLINSFAEKKRPVLIAALLSSIVFGLMHYVNLSHQPDNFSGITTQVVFATSIGVFFCGVLVRTGNIVIPSILHALVNFGFNASELIQQVEDVTGMEIEEAASIDWASKIFTFSLFGLILLGGVYMIWISDKDEVLSMLGENQTDNMIDSVQ